MRRTISALKSMIQGYFTSGSDKWTGQEVEDSFTDTIDSLASAIVTLTDGATILWDLSAGNFAKVTLGGNRTLTISNASTPCSGILWVAQDGTGSRTLTLPSGSKTPTGWALSTAAAPAVDVLGFTFDGTNYRWSIEKYSS